MLSDLTVPHPQTTGPDVCLGDDFRRATAFDGHVLLNQVKPDADAGQFL